MVGPGACADGQEIEGANGTEREKRHPLRGSVYGEERPRVGKELYYTSKHEVEDSPTPRCIRRMC